MAATDLIKAREEQAAALNNKLVARILTKNDLTRNPVQQAVRLISKSRRTATIDAPAATVTTATAGIRKRGRPRKILKANDEEEEEEEEKEEQEEKVEKIEKVDAVVEGTRKSRHSAKDCTKAADNRGNNDDDKDGDEDDADDGDDEDNDDGGGDLDDGDDDTGYFAGFEKKERRFKVLKCGLFADASGINGDIGGRPTATGKSSSRSSVDNHRNNTKSDE